MSTDENVESDVLGKLDKVADTLESASSQLSGVVTQQQLDLVRERVATCEADIAIAKQSCEVLAERTAAHASEADSSSIEL